MNKILKVIISAIICLALLVVPMTAMAEEGIDYNINYETYLTEGTNTYTVFDNVPYTVFILYPSAVGDYTITANANIGIVSYLDMWVQFEPTVDNVNTNTITWNCTDVNQAIMIAISPNASEEVITVTRTDPDASKEIPWTIYKNVKAPEKFQMPDFVDVDAFDDGYVDFEDSVIDDAILGDDGYYHLNDKNGPILFANLNDSIMSLYTMVGYGKIAAIYYDDAGEVVKKVDYTDAFNAYIAALPVNDQGTPTSYYYPLTADLIEMFKEIGASHEWYSGETWVYDSEDAWLFACYYDENVTSMDESSKNNQDNDGESDVDDNNDVSDDKTDDKTSGTENKENENPGDTTDKNDSNNNAESGKDTNINTDSKTTSPKTGDSVASVSIALICAVAVALGIKKK